MKCLQWTKEQVVLLKEERRHCSRSGIKKLDSPVLCQGDPKPQGSAVEKLWSGCSVEDEGGAGGSPGRMEEMEEEQEKDPEQNVHTRLVSHRPTREIGNR